MKRGLIIAFALAACGSLDAGGVDVDYCDLAIIIVGAEPLESGSTVVLGSEVDSNLIGFEQMVWDVEFGGAPITYTVRDEDGNTSIEFVASSPGPYDIRLDGAVGSFACTADERTVNVQAPAAIEASYLLQVVTDSGSAYSSLVTVYGGSDYGLGTVDLDNVSAQVLVRDHLGAPLDAYVELEALGAEAPIGELSTTAGSVQLALAAGDYRAAVTPFDVNKTPFVIPNLSAPNLPGSMTAPTPVVVASNVDSGGPLNLARVRISVDDGPGALATTNGLGNADVSVSPGLSASVVVVPPSGALLPRLSFELSEVPSNLDINYNTPTTRSWTFTVEDEDSNPIPNALVYLDGSLTNAGTHGSGSASGRYVATLQANGSGVVGPVDVINGVYKVVIDGGTVMPTLLSVDLRTGQTSPATLATRAAATVTGAVQGSGGAVALARVVAHATGGLTGYGADSEATLTDEAGQFSLALAAGEEYDVVVVAPESAAHASVTESITATDALSVPLQAPSALLLSGRFVRGAESLAGATVLLTDPVSGAVVASAITLEGGEFSLALPDPGTM